MAIREIILVAPISPLRLTKLKVAGYEVYAYCEGISQLVEVKKLGPDSQVLIGHWGYKWVPIAKLMKVIGKPPMADKRSIYSKKVTETFTPGKGAS